MLLLFRSAVVFSFVEPLPVAPSVDSVVVMPDVTVSLANSGCSRGREARAGCGSLHCWIYLSGHTFIRWTCCAALAIIGVEFMGCLLVKLMISRDAATQMPKTISVHRFSMIYFVLKICISCPV